MADKLLLVTTFVVLTLPAIPLTNHLPLWLTVIVISRDIVIVGVVAIVNLAVGPRTFRPSLLGKADDGGVHPDERRRHVSSTTGMRRRSLVDVGDLAVAGADAGLER